MFRSASDVSNVSVVTVNWNGQKHLETLLPSLQATGCGEVIVVDNGSTDGSQDYLRSRHPQARLIQNPVNEGFAHPCNQGAQAAKGRWVAFINNDMRADGQWLAKALERTGDGIPCVASRILDWDGRRIDYNGSSLQYLGFALQRDIGEIAQEVSHQDRVLFPCGGAMLVDRELYLQLEGFDSDFFAIYEDVDFGWRLWLSGFQVAFAPDSIVCHRSHATFDQHANERMRYLMHRNALLTVLKNYGGELLHRIFPLAVRLGIKRAVRLSGVDKESFYLWGQARHELRSGGQEARERWIDALNHLVALDDVLERLPETLEKRRRVQARRRRPDEEIVKLFGDPLRRIVEDPEYQAEERAWLDRLGLEKWFPVDSAGADEKELRESLGERVRALRSELDALQWIEGKAWQTPPPPRRPGLKAVARSLRRHGALATARRVFRRLRRGH